MTDPVSQPARRSARWAVVIPLVLFAALVALFYFRLYSGDPSTIPSALIGRPAPEFTLPPLDGLKTADGSPVPGLSKADLTQGHVTIVNVWASWCAPCRDEHPLLLRLSQLGRARLVGIAYKDEPANSLKFLGDLGNPFAAIGVDEKGRAAIDWGVYGVPETFIVGKDGTIAYKHIGPLTEAAITDIILPEIDKAERGTASAGL
ncbi:DsbE family thiol:disulfide interchange protein [Flaviflagellibacter deserti]|uniref:DsbE family thiol:disulfide interchange protein n=1 Tax=Flaviflagellibacter deserti TaxID=2267266 RepID=A0ABV9Z4G9_9HYPH